VAGLRKLAQQENLDLIIGPGITPPGLATGPVAEKLGVWFMLETAQREPWENTKYVFSNISPQDTYSPLIANYLEQQMEDGASKVAILYANVPYGQAGNELLKQEAEKMGWDVVVNEAFDPSQFQFRSQAQKVAQANPDGMMIWGAATPADAQILKQVRSAGYDGPASGDVAFTLPFIPEVAGPAAETIVMPSQLNFVDPDEQTQKFLESYEQTYESPPTFLPAAAYDAVHILAEAIKKADCNADAESVAEAMNSGLEYTGVSGQFSYDEEYKGGPVAEAFRPMTFKDGEYAEPENVEDVD
jgi:branched-chain amino acid transport system substrate-binding protein